MRLLIALVVALFSVDRSSAVEPMRMEWSIDGVQREADVYAPSLLTSEPPPLVFGFHGHGGNMRNAARSFRMHELWPEAVVVYMQGLNTPGRLTDPEGKKPGWQRSQGDQGDRDLKFFDAALASMKDKYKIDPRRVYSTGHSNGGGFTYLLWDARGDVLAAVAPSAAVGARSASNLKPMPVMHIAGESDALVKFAWQQAAMTRLRTLNECGDGTPWHNHKNCTIYSSKSGNAVVTMIHPGTHKYPAEAPAMIVTFFKEHRQPAPNTSTRPTAPATAAQ